MIVHLAGEADAWDLGAARHLRNRVSGWKIRGLHVHIQIPKGVLPLLDEASAYRLAAFATNEFIVEEADVTELLDGFLPVISLKAGDEYLTWATNNADLATPNRYWGVTPAGSRLLSGRLSTALKGVQLAADALRPSMQSATEIEITNGLDGNLKNFGERFWDLLATHSAPLQAALSGKDELRKITYSDRYVRNPLTCGILLTAVHQLSHRAPSSAEISICIYGQKYQKEGFPPNKIWHDWLSHEERDTALSAAFDYCGLKATIKSHDKRPHGRYLDIELASSQSIRVRLDQGFSYWELGNSGAGTRKDYFEFKANAERQGQLIASMPLDVAAPKGTDTQIFIKELT